MSRLDYIYLGTVIVGALTGIIGCVKSIGEEIYRGNINGQEVVYSEGLYHCGGPTSDEFLMGKKHQMKVKQGDVEYLLIDDKQETNIQNPDFAQAKLERIIIKTDSGKEDLRVKSQDEALSQYGETLEDVHTKSVFERGNKLYNDLRDKIREEIESGYRATEAKFLNVKYS